MNLGKRLSNLEIIYRPADHTTLTERDQRWYLELCEASKVETIWRFAKYLAERRYNHEHGKGARWCDSWKEETTPAEREAMVRAEIERFLATDPYDDEALTAWIEAADREGWPPLQGPTFPISREGFETVLVHARQGIDTARASSTPDAVAWRKDHPQWRPGMTGEEMLAFELALDQEAVRRHAEWFGDEAA